MQNNVTRNSMGVLKLKGFPNVLFSAQIPLCLGLWMSCQAACWKMEIWFSTTCLKPLIRSQLGLQSRWVWIHFTLVGLCCPPPPPGERYTPALLDTGTHRPRQLLHRRLVETLTLHQTIQPMEELALLLQPWCPRFDSSCPQNWRRPVCVLDLAFAAGIEGLLYANEKWVDCFIFTKSLLGQDKWTHWPWLAFRIGFFMLEEVGRIA